MGRICTHRKLEKRDSGESCAVPGVCSACIGKVSFGFAEAIMLSLPLEPTTYKTLYTPIHFPSRSGQARPMLMLRPALYRHVISPPRLGLRAHRNASTRAPRPTRAPASPTYLPFEPPANAQAFAQSDTPARRGGTAAPVILGTLAVLIGFYATQIYIAVNKPCTKPHIKDLDQQKDVAARYDETADNFDSEVGTSEALMGINRIRKRLSRMCKGHVLEVSCGTGRNLGYYDLGKSSEVDSLSFIDLSKQMVDMCKKKWTALYGPTVPHHFKDGLQVRFMTGSALDTMPLAPGGKKYDTIVQTMGLCSTPEPQELLVNIAKHLNTENPDARILLLEHGRSYQEWLNNVLDNFAEKHAEIHGCWFNRDIGGLVEDAAERSGLEVVRERRKHFGTTWVFELKPKVTAAKQAKLETEKAPADAEEQTKGTGWRGLLGWK